MKNPSNYYRSALAATIASLSVPGLVWAQEFRLEEVVVTAQKRVESMQDIPVSVSALSSSDMESLKLNTGADIAPYIPNLSVNLPYGEGSAPFFSLRGITMTDFSQNQSSPIALYVDEVYKSVGALQSMQIYDLERIEVLRGPQGTLYGKNATGGAVNFIARKPDFENLAHLTFGFGNYSRKEARGVLQAELVDEVLASRLAFTYVDADGVTKNLYPGGKDQGELDQWAFRLGFQYEPTDNVSAYLRVSSSRSRGQNHGVYADNIYEPWLGVDRTGLDFDENESDWNIPDRSMENTAYALTVNWDINESHSLTSITAYDKGEWLSPEDDDGLPISLLHNNYESDVRQFTQEFRVSSDYNGPFNWIGGVYWGRDEVEMDTTLLLWNEPSLGVDVSYLLGLPDRSLGGWGLNQTNSFEQTRTSLATYLHTTYDITDALTLTVGLRYTEDDTEVEDYIALIGVTPEGGDPELNIPTIGAEIGGYPAPEIDFTDTDTSARVGLDWSVSEDVMLYVSFSQGYRSGAVNAQAFFDPSEITTVDPEELDAWELGVKSTLLEGRIRLNGAIFQYDYTNQQFLDVIEGGLQILRNADESEVKGGEIEATIQAAENVTLRLGAGYLDGEYKKLELGGVDLSGNEMMATPELSFTAAIDWDFLQIDAGLFRLHLDTSFSDQQYYDAANTKRIQIDDYWLTNGRVVFDSADDQYTVSAWVRNLADEEYFTYALDLNSAGLGFDYFSRGLTRTYGVEFTYRM